MYNKNAWKKYKDYSEIMNFAEGYKEFISIGKTEREVVKESVDLLEKKGYRDIKTFNSLKPGDKVYATNKNKNIACFIIGSESLEKGLRVLGAQLTHLESMLNKTLYMKKTILPF